MQAFRLTDEAKAEGFSGGSIKATEQGHMFDIGGALTGPGQDGTNQILPDRVLVTYDDIFGSVLASHPALERVPEDQVPQDAQVVQAPRDVITTADTAPFTPQTNDVTIGKSVAQIAAERASTEIGAVHADDPDTPEQALAVGQQVSGQAPGSEGQPDVGVPGSSQDEPDPNALQGTDVTDHE